MDTNTIQYRTKKCSWCGEDSVIEIPKDGFNAWKEGKGLHVQDAFPNLSRDVREQLITGIHPVCWDLMFEE